MAASHYHYSLDEEAVLFCASQPPRSRAKLLRRFDHLALHPFVLGELREPGEEFLSAVRAAIVVCTEKASHSS